MKVCILLALFIALLPFTATAQQGGILGKKAPEIKADKWVSLPKGESAPASESLTGKIIYLYNFQSWCPGCHSSGFPTLQKVSQHFKNNDNVECIAMQTVFEGFDSNTPSRARDMVTKYNLHHIAVGHSGSRKKASSIMRDFRTRGTPWTIIIGADGIVKYNAFHITSDKAIALINKLQKAKN